MAQLGDAIAISAEYRTESRGGHYREDFPVRDDARWRRPTYLLWRDGEYRFLAGRTQAAAMAQVAP